MLPLACDLEQHFQDFSIRTSQRGKNHLQVKGNIDKTRRMINEMKIVQHVNSTTQQQQEQLLCFPRAFSLSLGGNNRSVFLKLINYSYGYKPIGVPHFSQVHVS